MSDAALKYQAWITIATLLTVCINTVVVPCINGLVTRWLDGRQQKRADAADVKTDAVAASLEVQGDRVASTLKTETAKIADKVATVGQKLTESTIANAEHIADVTATQTATLGDILRATSSDVKDTVAAWGPAAADDKKLDALVEFAKTSATVAKSTHAFTNSRLTAEMRDKAELSRWKANQTQKPEDRRAADIAETAYQDQLSAQARVDAQPGTDDEKKGIA
jgi:hypothetical protein